ncbi:arsenosugar biosynthesis radical SAM (seleno)protein ArsS [Anditalea andensis]|uniref:Fe-S oxidoreductase n=1 Tax=Anditalea andensis TaxID=1048983 RepID=A0A074L0X1_9BACT|nr:arsenosugar biosynthesis radical SAM (seleno)protein ArsS [Anditalea andensis]KEO73503.1 Fe-S oxidoreductase [Anditalea andensis]
MKSLEAEGQALAKGPLQIQFLENTPINGYGFTSFQDKLNEIDLYPLKPTGIEIFQINLGKMCNQVCKHCHVDAGPDRKEIMTRETMDACLNAIEESGAHTVDLTGGAPEMNPDFRYLVEKLSGLGKKIIVRCNLTIIVANPRFHDLPDFFKKHKVEVVSSLPYFTAVKTDSQRGEGVFEKSIHALKKLNAVGYGMEQSGLILNLVYNPSGAFLPPNERDLKLQFQKKLRDKYGIYFNELFTITNLPISRFLDYLVKSDNYEAYMEKLIERFNPTAAHNVMCRNTISVGWDGFLYDCDFNQMLDLKLDIPDPHLNNFRRETFNIRNIVTNNHCFGCTAGAGSSCGGAISG